MKINKKYIITIMAAVIALGSLLVITNQFNSEWGYQGGASDESVVRTCGLILAGLKSQDNDEAFRLSECEARGLMDEAQRYAEVYKATGSQKAAREAVFGSSTAKNANSSKASKKTSKPSITKSEWSENKAYVITSKKAVYNAYESSREEIGSESKGTEVIIKGETSNGFYFYDYTNEIGETVEGYLLFKDKDNIVEKSLYDNAWELTETKDATCEKTGYNLYVNSYSGLKNKEEIEAIGHVLGDEELQKEATFFENGLIVTHCANCDEIIDKRDINSGFEDNKSLIIGCTSVIGILLLLLIIAAVAGNKKQKAYA